jgi:hypothetical protein
MLPNLLNKILQLKNDKVLRRWLVGRILGHWPGEPFFTAHRPPYLEGLLPLIQEIPSADFAELVHIAPTKSINISLAGKSLTLLPGDEETLFQRSFKDLESTLALHRFAWLPLLGNDVDPAWVTAIWRIWVKYYGVPVNCWAWHPYTASERAINILVFAQNAGIPDPIKHSLSVLTAHGPAIAERLEYFGDHHTSNHLANNGRGLFLLGLFLGLPKCAELGGLILVKEAGRIFSSSGILREGSTHYHALLAANYSQCADIATKLERPESLALSTISQRARNVVSCLKLPGGFPLIGDISPDLPPDLILKAMAVTENKNAKALEENGWYRLDSGPWSGLWHIAPDGFSHMPGHGHQDCGSFELHFKEQPVFIDPGRGSYTESAESTKYCSSMTHNTLLIDNTDTYPANKPYYNDTFRRQIAGPPPSVKMNQNSIRISHDGFKRLKNVGSLCRHWHFNQTSMTLNDSIDGSLNHILSRHLVTPLDVSKSSGGVMLRGRDVEFNLSVDGDITIELITRWTAYGQGESVTAIQIISETALPWTGSLSLEVL